MGNLILNIKPSIKLACHVLQKYLLLLSSYSICFLSGLYEAKQGKKRAHFFKLKHRYFGAPENNSTIQNLPEFFNGIINGTRMSCIFLKKNYGSSRTVTELKGKPFKVSNKITILLAKHGMFNLISTCVTVNPQLNDHAMCFENIPIY